MYFLYHYYIDSIKWLKNNLKFTNIDYYDRGVCENHPTNNVLTN